jgi:hypothetical protein
VYPWKRDRGVTVHLFLTHAGTFLTILCVGKFCRDDEIRRPQSKLLSRLNFLLFRNVCHLSPANLSFWLLPRVSVSARGARSFARSRRCFSWDCLISEALLVHKTTSVRGVICSCFRRTLPCKYGTYSCQLQLTGTSLHTHVLVCFQFWRIHFWAVLRTSTN